MGVSSDKLFSQVTDAYECCLRAGMDGEDNIMEVRDSIYYVNTAGIRLESHFVGSFRSGFLTNFVGEV